MSRSSVACLLLAGVFLIAGCGAKQETVGQTGAPEREEPDYVGVQHILVGYKGSVQGKDITRTQAEARELAVELLRRAKGGEDFDMLVEEYTDDSVPGIYELANSKKGISANPDRLIYARDDMARAFGDVSFSLDVGGFGMAESKYGWHVITRIK